MVVSNDFEGDFVDDRVGAVGDDVGFEEALSDLVEDLRVASIFVKLSLEEGESSGDISAVAWFWLDRLFLFLFGDTRSLAEELFGADMLTLSPTFSDFFATEDVEVELIVPTLLPRVFPLSLADELLDGDIRTLPPVMFDVLEVEGGELELALGLIPLEIGFDGAAGERIGLLGLSPDGGDDGTEVEMVGLVLMPPEDEERLFTLRDDELRLDLVEDDDGREDE